MANIDILSQISQTFNASVVTPKEKVEKKHEWCSPYNLVDNTGKALKQKKSYSQMFNCVTYVSCGHLHFIGTKVNPEAEAEEVYYDTFQEAYEVAQFLIKHRVRVGQYGVFSIMVEGKEGKNKGKFAIVPTYFPATDKK